MMATKWSNGDLVNLTTTTAGAELLEIVGFRRSAGGVQYVVLASPETASGIRTGKVDATTIYLTGIGGRVRQVETQRFHRLTARGLAVRA